MPLVVIVWLSRPHANLGAIRYQGEIESNGDDDKSRFEG
jgi:hypothetical protein